MSVPLKSDNLRVVLVESRNPLNIGAAARAMSNFGFLRLRVVNPVRSGLSQGANQRLGLPHCWQQAEEYESVAEAVADCTLVVGTTAVRHRELQHPMRRLEYGARLIRKRMRSSRGGAAVWLGEVRTFNARSSHCHWLMRIPTRGAHLHEPGAGGGGVSVRTDSHDRAAGVSEICPRPGRKSNA